VSNYLGLYKLVPLDYTAFTKRERKQRKNSKKSKSTPVLVVTVNADTSTDVFYRLYLVIIT